MEIIRCHKSRIILFLSPEDMKKYHIDSEKFDINANDLQTILNDTETSDGFPQKSRILVKIFESKGGGCELFITNLGDLPTASEETAGRASYIYRFPDIESLLPACKALSTAKCRGKVYCDKDKGYTYLVLDREILNIREFGAVACRKSAMMYIEEHCTPLQNMTPELLGELA